LQISSAGSSSLPALFALDKGVVLTGTLTSHHHRVFFWSLADGHFFMAHRKARESMHTTRNKALLKYVATRLLGATVQ
jgi:hypothetical protein